MNSNCFKVLFWFSVAKFYFDYNSIVIFIFLLLFLWGSELRVT